MDFVNGFVQKYRQNRRMLLGIVYVALFLDNMLLTTVVSSVMLSKVCHLPKRCPSFRSICFESNIPTTRTCFSMNASTSCLVPLQVRQSRADA